MTKQPSQLNGLQLNKDSKKIDKMGSQIELQITDTKNGKSGCYSNTIKSQKDSNQIKPIQQRFVVFIREPIVFDNILYQDSSFQSDKFVVVQDLQNRNSGKQIG
ncbi:unnamed protein product [Paramecium octaurelia]|uniref:Uncharacterized protein n=1 Tax=Paramecium octaurelia TaxID=43137 RepID=A0A8S1V6N1_PAROT|nr:unnamed protein product [Paramecium octaurelia]